MADLTISIDLDSRGVKTGASEARSHLKSIANVDFSGLRQKLNQASEMVKNFGSQISAAGRTLSLFVSAPLAGLATLAARFTALKERAELSFRVLLRDGEKAKQLMKDLTEFADRTPFESQEIIDAGRLLVAYGVDAKNVKEILTDLGDTAAAMEVNIVEVARAFGRLKSGDFGEAFERMRDFGISRELLEAKGLKFDKSGQFLGSVDEAMTAVRQVIQEKFGGTMDELSDSISGKFSTVVDKAKGLLIKLFEPVQPIISQQLTNLIGLIEQAITWFDQASPTVRVFIVAIGAIAAAIGPALLVLGTLITAIGSLVGALTAIGSAAPVIGIVAAAIVGLGIQLAPVIAYVAALYAAWQTNFGGIRDLTNIVVEAIKGYWAEMVARVTELTEQVTAEVKVFWEQNGEDIMRAVGKVSDFIRSIWTGIVAFWRENGDTIKAMTTAAWNVIKTVVLTVVRQIGNVIKLVAAIINGDWSKAWEATKEIIKTAISAWVSLLTNSGNLLVGGIKLALNAVWALTTWIAEQAKALGKSLIDGLVSGITANSGRVVGVITSLMNRDVVGLTRNLIESRSPSRVFHRIGGDIGEGLTLGIESKVERAKKSAKKLADETIKQLKEAAKEFQKLAGASPEQVTRIQQANEYQEAAAAQQEIIRLRKELGVNQNRSLPGTPSATQQELKNLQAQKKAIDDVNAAAEKLTQELLQQWEAFEQKKKAIEETGAIELLNLQEEINLVGVTDEMERLRISNHFELLRLREEMKQDGFAEDQIEETERILKTEQARRLELQRILEIRKQVSEATKLGKDLVGELEQLQRGNVELTKYEEILRRISTDLKDINPQQKEYLLNLAQQIDAQKAYNEAWNKTYDFIRGAFDVLTDSSKSFGDRLKTLFGGIVDRFRKMLLDLAAEWLTSKFFQMFFKGGNAQAASGSGQGGGGLFGGIFNAIFGGGGQGGGGFAGFGGFGGINIGNILNRNGTGIAFGGGSQGATTGHEGIHAIGGRGGGRQLFGGGLSTGIGIASLGANILGGMIGGRWGNTISLAGTGLGIGFMVGGPVGAAIGAGIGALGGLLMGIFGGDPKRKRDKKEKMPALQKGFVDAIKQLNDLIRDVRTLRVDPESALARAAEIRSEIAGGFGLQFESKKYRRESQRLIQAKLREADALIEELRRVAEIARAAGERQRRILPEFAGGVFMSGSFLSQFTAFKRQYGMIPGPWNGRDTIPAMLARGEMVLNPYQQAAVKANAGFDVFKNAGIPGYAGGGMAGSQPSAPVTPIVVSTGPVQVTVMVEQDAAGIWRATAQSPTGQKVIANVVEKKFANDELRLRRR